MKALVLTEYKKMEILDVPMPVIQDDEVLIRVKACGICGSDIHGYDGSTGRRRPPIIMGHEASGIIVETGPKVENWKKDDRVTFDSTIYCGRCSYCNKGMVNLCENRRVLGVSCEEYHRDGAFAEYVAVPQHILYALPDSVSYDQAALVEPLSIAAHAVDISPHLLDASATVIGTGMVGLFVIQALRAKGYGKIIAVDHNQSKLDLALKLGADEAVLSDGHALEKILPLTNGRGTDASFEVAGTSEAFNLAVHSVCKGGSVTLVGNSSPKVDLPLQTIVTRQIRLQGSCASSGEYPACLNLIARGQVDVNSIISATAPLDEGPMWFDKLYHRNGPRLKVVLNP